MKNNTPSTIFIPVISLFSSKFNTLSASKTKCIFIGSFISLSPVQAPLFVRWFVALNSMPLALTLTTLTTTSSSIKVLVWPAFVHAFVPPDPAKHLTVIPTLTPSEEKLAPPVPCKV